MEIIKTILFVAFYLAMNILVWTLVFRQRRPIHTENNFSIAIDKEFLAKLAIEVAKLIKEQKGDENAK